MSRGSVHSRRTRHSDALEAPEIRTESGRRGAALPAVSTLLGTAAAPALRDLGLQQFNVRCTVSLGRSMANHNLVFIDFTDRKMYIPVTYTIVYDVMHVNHDFVNRSVRNCSVLSDTPFLDKKYRLVYTRCQIQ